MTPLARLARNLAQKVAGVFYEGPEPPARIEDLAVDFANLNPRATRGEWLRFAVDLARMQYRDGWARGWEEVERVEVPEHKRLPPELVADYIDPDWRNGPAFGDVALDPDEVPPEEFDAAPVDVLKHAGNAAPARRVRR